MPLNFLMQLLKFKCAFGKVENVQAFYKIKLNINLLICTLQYYSKVNYSVD